MNRNQKILLAVGAMGVVMLTVRPPYFGIDRESGGRLHAFIGYHWIWEPPSAAEVYEKLTKSDPAEVDRRRLASFEARINAVRWIENAVAAGAMIALGVLLLRKRPKASREETILLSELRAAFREPPAPETAPATPSEAAWSSNMNRLRQLVLSRDPREFLRWDVISDTMFVSGADYVSTELKFLESRPDWDPRWREAIRESPVGRPLPCRFHPASSGNLIHHAYHVARFEEKTAARVRDLDFVFEFGGGYGSMCRLFHRLGFRGKYVIYDLPPFAALQVYFLKSLGLPVQGASEAARSRAGIACLSDLGSLKAALGEQAQTGSDALFLATWSISESPIAVRDAVLPLTSGFGSFLIAYQDRFGEVDNVQFFADWRKSIEGVAWHGWPIEHLPGNHYLVGSRGSRAG